MKGERLIPGAQPSPLEPQTTTQRPLIIDGPVPGLEGKLLAATIVEGQRGGMPLVRSDTPGEAGVLAGVVGPGIVDVYITKRTADGDVEETTVIATDLNAAKKLVESLPKIPHIELTERS